MTPWLTIDDQWRRVTDLERRLRHGQLRRSGIFVEPMTPKSKSEPQRGGIMCGAVYAAPPELGPRDSRMNGIADVDTTNPVF
jgi:hypothetical protein